MKFNEPPSTAQHIYEHSPDSASHCLWHTFGLLVTFFKFFLTNAVSNAFFFHLHVAAEVSFISPQGKIFGLCLPACQNGTIDLSSLPPRPSPEWSLKESL